MKINFLKVSQIGIHFEVVTDNDATYYYRVFTNTITWPYPRPIGITGYPPEYVTKAASVAIKKVYKILSTVHIMGLNTSESIVLSSGDSVFSGLHHKKYGDLSEVVKAVNEILKNSI